MRRSQCCVVAIGLLGAFLLTSGTANAQAFGVELHNNLMPASAGMGGASLARPQDVQSAINGNAATMADFRGTSFGFSGVWLEPTINLSHTGTALPSIGTFDGKSKAQGSALGNIAVLQDLRPMGIPATAGIALIGSSGAGVSFRHIPESNGTSALLQVLQITGGVGVDLTDELSIGANLMLGSGTLDGPFVELTAAAYDYALRGSVGINYDFGNETTFGFYYQTPQHFNFDNAALINLPGGGTALPDINVDLPENLGIGFANQSLMDGRLLLAVDLLHKNWEDTALFGAIYENQWALQTGLQYELNDKMKMRLGYAYAEDIMLANPGDGAGGLRPGQAGVRYIQAQFPSFSRHRLSGGIGVRDLIPNVDFDLFAGGMPRASKRFGAFTRSNIETYWIGFGMTWHFGGCSEGCQ